MKTTEVIWLISQHSIHIIFQAISIHISLQELAIKNIGLPKYTVYIICMNDEAYKLIDISLSTLYFHWMI